MTKKVEIQENEKPIKEGTEIKDKKPENNKKNKIYKAAKPKNIINKKELIISKDGSQHSIPKDEKLEDVKSKKINVDDKNIKYKIIKILRFRNPLKMYFNKWRNIVNLPKRKKYPENNFQISYAEHLEIKMNKREKFNKIIKKILKNYMTDNEKLYHYYHVWLSKMPFKIIKNITNVTEVNIVSSKKLISIVKNVNKDNKSNNEEDNNKDTHQDKHNTKPEKESYEIENKNLEITNTTNISKNN